MTTPTEQRSELAAEYDRLKETDAAYEGEKEAVFDVAMRTFMMRTFEPFWRPGSCLQVGCSHGDQTSLLSKRFTDLAVVEPMQPFIDYTRRKLDVEVAFHRALIEEFDPGRTYDNVVMTHVLEHVIDPVGVLRKLGSLLSANGRLFIAVPNGGAPSRMIAVKMGLIKHRTDLTKADHEAGHRRVYLLDTLLADARSAGLAEVGSGGIFYKPLANFQFNALMGSSLITDEFMEACYQLGKEWPHYGASIYVIAEAPALT